MTQAADIDMAQRLDKLTSIIERVDNHVQELRIEIKTFQARAEEQIKATQQQISDLDKSLNKRIDTLEQRSNGQETRFWGLVAILATTLLGVIGKVVFFPIDKV
jgi:chromosome segregation ATPase